MLKKLGGTDAVMSEFYSNRITEAASEGLALSELLAEAEADGWQEWFFSLKLNTIAKIINPAPAAATRTTGVAASPGHAAAAVPTKGRRLSKVQKAELVRKVIAFVGTSPWCAASEIGAAVDFDTRRLGPHLSGLRRAGELQAVGERSGTRYALPGVAPQPD